MASFTGLAVLALALQRLRRADDPVDNSDPVSLARKYQQDAGPRVSCGRRSDVESLALLRQLAQAVDQGALRSIASAPGGTKALLLTMCLPFGKPDGHAAPLYALQPFMVWDHKEHYRLFTSVFLHQDFFHLLSNIFSLTKSGSFLEATCGTTTFAAATASVAASSSALQVLYSRTAYKRLFDHRSYFHSMTVGASGLAYGLQVLADYKRAAAGFVGTHTVPLQYRCWVNLLRNQVMIPQASFTGHVCGILAGLVHVFLPKAVRGLCYFLIGGQHPREGKQHAEDDELELVQSFQLEDELEPHEVWGHRDRPSCAWSDLWVHAMCAVLCFCAHRASTKLWKRGQQILSKIVEVQLRRRTGWQAVLREVHEAVMGPQSTRDQRRLERRSARLRGRTMAQRRALAARNSQSARFL